MIPVPLVILVTWGSPIELRDRGKRALRSSAPQFHFNWLLLLLLLLLLFVIIVFRTTCPCSACLPRWGASSPRGITKLSFLYLEGAKHLIFNCRNEVLLAHTHWARKANLALIIKKQDLGHCTHPHVEGHKLVASFQVEYYSLYGIVFLKLYVSNTAPLPRSFFSLRLPFLLTSTTW